MVVTVMNRRCHSWFFSDAVVWM